MASAASDSADLTPYSMNVLALLHRLCPLADFFKHFRAVTSQPAGMASTMMPPPMVRAGDGHRMM